MKVLILYGSTTGNTEMVAEQIQDIMADHDVELMDVAEASADVFNDYDNIIAASSTWDDGLLQQDFRDFAKNLREAKPDLSSKKVAIVGLGDSNYPDFCEAAPLLEKLFSELGATQVGNSLKIDGFPDEEENEQKVEDWAETISQKMN